MPRCNFYAIMNGQWNVVRPKARGMELHMGLPPPENRRFSSTNVSSSWLIDTRKDAMKKTSSNISWFAEDYQRMTAGWQGASYNRKYDRELILKPAISLKKIWGGYRRRTRVYAVWRSILWEWSMGSTIYMMPWSMSTKCQRGQDTHTLTGRPMRRQQRMGPQRTHWDIAVIICVSHGARCLVKQKCRRIIYRHDIIA